MKVDIEPDEMQLLSAILLAYQTSDSVTDKNMKMTLSRLGLKLMNAIYEEELNNMINGDDKK